MYLTQLSVLNLDLELLEKLDNYLSNLNLSERQNITFTTLMQKLNLDYQKALELKTVLEENNYILQYYVIYCPECGLLVKKFDDIVEIREDEKCYNCEESLLKERDFIDIRYKLNDKIFPYSKKDNANISERTIREYSLKNADRNNFLYHITEDEKDELLKDLEHVINGSFSIPKQKGDALEKFSIKLLNKIRCLECFPFRTSVNQIDNMVHNRLHKLIFEGLSKYIIVECKNEESKPDVTYIDKLHGIIQTKNDRNLFNSGLVISKKKPTAQFIETSYLYMNNQSQVAIISITLEEIKELLQTNRNLIDFIEDKLLKLHCNQL